MEARRPTSTSATSSKARPGLRAEEARPSAVLIDAAESAEVWRSRKVRWRASLLAEKGASSSRSASGAASSESMEEPSTNATERPVGESACTLGAAPKP